MKLRRRFSLFHERSVLQGFSISEAVQQKVFLETAVEGMAGTEQRAQAAVALVGNLMQKLHVKGVLTKEDVLDLVDRTFWEEHKE